MKLVMRASWFLFLISFCAAIGTFNRGGGELCLMGARSAFLKSLMLLRNPATTELCSPFSGLMACFGA